MNQNTFFTLLVATFLFFACSSNPTASKDPGSISGTVYDATTGSVLAKANVITTPPTFSVTTDTLGSYTITNVDAGTYRVTAAKFGYDSAGVNVSVSKDLITVADIPLLLDTLSVN